MIHLTVHPQISQIAADHSSEFTLQQSSYICVNLRIKNICRGSFDAPTLSGIPNNQYDEGSSTGGKGGNGENAPIPNSVSSVSSCSMLSFFLLLFQ
jgi:hypothetical protein